MGNRWQSAPWWVLSILAGSIFGLGMAVSVLVRGDPVRSAAVIGVVGGVFFGGVMGPFMVRLRRFFEADLPPGTPAQHRAGTRAATRGPIPHDAAARRIATHQARRRLDFAQRSRWFVRAAFAFAAAANLLAAVLTSPWFVPSVVVFTGLLVVTWQQPGRLSRRLTQLTADEAGGARGVETT